MFNCHHSQLRTWARAKNSAYQGIGVQWESCIDHRQILRSTYGSDPGFHEFQKKWKSKHARKQWSGVVATTAQSRWHLKCHVPNSVPVRPHDAPWTNDPKAKRRRVTIQLTLPHSGEWKTAKLGSQRWNWWKCGWECEIKSGQVTSSVNLSFLG